MSSLSTSTTYNTNSTYIFIIINSSILWQCAMCQCAEFTDVVADDYYVIPGIDITSWYDDH